MYRFQKKTHSKHTLNIFNIDKNNFLFEQQISILEYTL